MRRWIDRPHGRINAQTAEVGPKERDLGSFGTVKADSSWETPLHEMTTLDGSRAPLTSRRPRVRNAAGRLADSRPESRSGRADAEGRGAAKRCWTTRAHTTSDSNGASGRDEPQLPWATAASRVVVVRP